MAAPSNSLFANQPDATGSTKTFNAGDAKYTHNGQDVAYSEHLNPDTGQTTYDVNTNVAQNPYLAGDLQTINNLANKIQGQQASLAQTPGAAQVSQAQQANINQTGFNAQKQALQYAQQQALGQGPAAQAIQMQTQNAIQQGLNSQAALLGNTRGGNPGQALRQMRLGQAQVVGQAANQSAMNTLNAEQAGQQNLGTVSGAMQGESLQQAQLQQQNAQYNASAQNTQGLQTQQLQQQTALANQQAQNQFQVQQDQLIQSLMDQGMSLEQAQAQANIQMAEYATGSQAAQAAAQQGHAISQQAADTQSAATAIQGVSTAANIAGSIGSAASDERAKKDIKEGDLDVEKFLDHIKAQEWMYKDPEHDGSGPHLGVMAQDLEKTPMGAHLIGRDERGMRTVDYGPNGMAAVLASLAYLNGKVKSLESSHAS